MGFRVNEERLRALPRDLLDGSRESARMAERIMRMFGVLEHSDNAPRSLADRLAWAIAAVESEECSESGDQADGSEPL